MNIAPSLAPDGAARAINPMQIANVDGKWVAATKEGDWWGSRIYVDVSKRPMGPWTTVGVIDATTPNPEENNYFASIVETGPGYIVIGLSHNRWDGARSTIYRPTFQNFVL